ncbi:hypothetical protein J6590_002817 [Homalodisca vitripennis]|nr:hypothetical protein J6590_002817 [Homalodisca vitripennis]
MEGDLKRVCLSTSRFSPPRPSLLTLPDVIHSHILILESLYISLLTPASLSPRTAQCVSQSYTNAGVSLHLASHPRVPLSSLILPDVFHSHK